MSPPRNHHGYIKRRSALLQPSSLAPPVTPEVPNPLKVHSVHWRRLWGLPKLTMVNQDEEGVVYSDHSGDERPQNQQNQQQVDLDLNSTANASQESVGRNTEAAGTQNGQPNLNSNNLEGRRSTSAFDRLGPGQPALRPFGGIGTMTLRSCKI
ncbi:hypothetical protein PIB30_056123 [Stylosanthes scabra]|uniref:Uncharacterized protein n=1 Tax=Stylosanthes scabra TaxID=79078 RepID=A0ABU6QJ71_9FABA|nr:hypothetical protein [Stylosanthes scabra]